jgi:hypothetical protein
LSADFKNDLAFYLSIAATTLSVILGLLRVRDYVRGGVKVELFQATPVDQDNLHVVFWIRNQDDTPTSLRRAYHEWGARSRSFYRRSFTFHHQELELRECDASSVYDMMKPHTKSQLESMGISVKLPLLIPAGDTKNFHTFLQKKDPRDKHHLVFSTTRKRFVKNLWSKLFEKGFKYEIHGVFAE